MDRIVAFVSNQPEALPAAIVVDGTAVDASHRPSNKWFTVFHQRGEPLLRQRASVGAPDGTTAKMLAELRAENVLLLAHRHPDPMRALEKDCVNVPVRFSAWSGAVSAEDPVTGERLFRGLPEFLQRESGGTMEARALFGLALLHVHERTHLHASSIPLKLLVAAVKNALEQWTLASDRSSKIPVIFAIQHLDAVAVGALHSPIRAIRRVGIHGADERAKLTEQPSVARAVQMDRLRYVWICADDQRPEHWQSWHAANGLVVGADRATELSLEEW